MYSVLSCHLPFLVQSIGFKGILLYGDEKQKAKYIPQVQYTVCTYVQCHTYIPYVRTSVHTVHVYAVFLLTIPTVHQYIRTYILYDTSVCTYIICMVQYTILLLAVCMYIRIYVIWTCIVHTYLGHNTSNTIICALLLLYV